MDAINWPPSTMSPSTNMGSERHHILSMVSILLLVICLGSLGSFTLASYLLPGLSTFPTRHALPTPSPTNFTNVHPGTGGCTAMPQDMKYMSTKQGQTTPVLSDDWAKVERGKTDFANAQACAASFVISYETFDAAHSQTLEASTYMLTDGGKGRFYRNNPDGRMDPMRQASLRKQHHRQKAQAGMPSLLTSQYIGGKLFVWLLLTCQISIQSDNIQPFVRNAQFTVLLVAVPVNSMNNSTGWQVSQWEEGNTQFAIPNPI